MSKAVRIQAANLAVDAAHSLASHVTASEIFSLCIMFESWILNGGDETQRRMKLLPEDTNVVVKMVKP